MTPKDLHRQSLTLMELLPGRPSTGGALAFMREALDAHLDNLRTPILFCGTVGQPDHWKVGRQGDERTLICKLPALSAAWMAIGYGSVNLRDFCDPEAAASADIVRRSLRNACAEWAERVAQCRPLANALRSMRTEGDRLIYLPSASQPRFVTGLEILGR